LTDRSAGQPARRRPKQGRYRCRLGDIRESGAIADQAAGSGKGSPLEDRGKAVAERQGGKSDACAEEKLIVGDDEATRSRLGEFSKDIAKITCRTRADKLCLHADFLSRAEYVVRTCVLIGILRIEKQAEYWRIWSGGVQQLESLLFPPNRHAGHAGHIRSGMVEAVDQSDLGRIGTHRNTTGIFVVAALTAAAAGLPKAAIKVTRRLTS